MAGNVSLATLTTRVRQRSDMQNTTFVTDAEIQAYLSDSFGRLLDIILETAPSANYSAESATISTVSGTTNYAILRTLPSTLANPYKVLAVLVNIDGQFRPVRPGRPQDDPIEASQGWQSPYSVRYYFSQITTDYITASGSPEQPSITFVPAPRAVHTFKVVYIPFPNMWDAEGTTTVFQGLTGWDEWCVLDAAAKCLEKEESDTTRLEQRKLVLEDQIRHHAQSRDLYGGQTIIDASANDISNYAPWELLPRA